MLVFLNVYNIFLCSLGQACNHIAALLVYIEYHAHDDELPTEKSRTSLSMRWNQPPKKTVAPDRVVIIPRNGTARHGTEYSGTF